MDFQEQDTLKEIVEFYVDFCKNSLDKQTNDFEKEVIQNKIEKANTLKVKYCIDVLNR